MTSCGWAGCATFALRFTLSILFESGLLEPDVEELLDTAFASGFLGLDVGELLLVVVGGWTLSPLSCQSIPSSDGSDSGTTSTTLLRRGDEVEREIMGEGYEFDSERETPVKFEVALGRLRFIEDEPDDDILRGLSIRMRLALSVLSLLASFNASTVEVKGLVLPFRTSADNGEALRRPASFIAFVIGEEPEGRDGRSLRECEEAEPTDGLCLDDDEDDEEEGCLELASLGLAALLLPAAAMTSAMLLEDL